jgi:hypothetical protein
MQRSAYPEWPEVKRRIVVEAAELGIELHGPELVAVPEQVKKGQNAKNKAQGGSQPIEALAAYAERKALPAPLTKALEGFLKQAMKG